MKLGVVRSLFGNAPDDEEVARVVQQAIDRLKAIGAEPVDVVVPGLDDLLRDGSVIVHEFKTDLGTYLKGVPNAPLVDPEKIVTEGLYHVQLESTFTQRLAPTVKPDAEAYRRALVKRGTLREVLLGTLEQYRRQGPRLSDNPPQGSADRRSATRHHLPGQRPFGPAGAERSGRLHR